MNIAQILNRSAKIYPDKAALLVGDNPVLTYAQLVSRVARLASALRNQYRVKPGDRVAIFASNCPEYLEALYAIYWIGAVSIPINFKLHPKELQYILEDSGAMVLMVSHDTNPNSAEITQLAQTIIFDSPEYIKALDSSPIDLVSRELDDVASLFYTSGTTGRPKGVMLSHHNLMTMCGHYFADVDDIGVQDCIIHAAPMSHGSGLYSLPHLARGACNVIPESGGFDAQELFDLGGHWQGIAMFAAPTMLKRLVEAPSDDLFPGLKTIIYGGGPMYVADIEAALARFGPRFVQIYGQGESPMTITVSSKDIHRDAKHPRHALRLASVGRPFQGLQVQVLDEHDQPVPVDEIGEVCVRGEVVMQGYWENTAASDQALRNGWLHTGDMGSLDEEGFLTLKDRSKDLIISGGSNIYPREVEEVLLLHPSVSEVSVVGRTHPEWGEEVVAFVVLRPPTRVSESQTLHELDAHCLSNMARFKRPKQYWVVDQLPKNETGKVLKTELRQRLYV